MESGKTALNQAAQDAAAAQPPTAGGAAPVLGAGTDDAIHDQWHDRCYNPVDSAPRGMIGATLNADSGRYKKGPGPV